GSSFFGATLTDRETDGQGHNRVLGPDFQWRPTEYAPLTGQLLFSDPTGALARAARAWAASIDSYRQVARYDCELIVRNVGSGFRGDDGFIPQAGYRHYEANGGLRFFPERGFFRLIRPYVWAHLETDQSGLTLFHDLGPVIHMDRPRK